MTTRDQIINERDPFWHWVARRLPMRLVRAVVVLAVRKTGRIRVSHRGVPNPVSAEDVVDGVRVR